MSTSSSTSSATSSAYVVALVGSGRVAEVAKATGLPVVASHAERLGTLMGVFSDPDTRAHYARAHPEFDDFVTWWNYLPKKDQTHEYAREAAADKVAELLAESLASSTHPCVVLCAPSEAEVDDLADEVWHVVPSPDDLPEGWDTALFVETASVDALESMVQDLVKELPLGKPTTA